MRPMVNPRRNVERFEPVQARMVRFTILATADGTEPCLDEVEVFTGGSGMEGAGFPPRPPGERVPEGRVRGEGIGVTSGAGDRPVSPGARPLTPPLSPLGRGRQVVSDATLLGEALAGLGPLPAGKRVPEGRVRGQGLGATKGAGARSPTAAGASPRLHHPVNVALTSAGGKASASSEYPDAAIHKIAHLNDGRVGNGRSWISRVPGKGSITIAWPEPATIDRVVWGRDREEVYRDRLATDYYLEVALEPGRWQVVASSLDRVRVSSQWSPAKSASTAAGLDARGGSRAGRVERPANGAPHTALATGRDVQGLCRHVQPAGADAPVGARRSDQKRGGGEAADDRRDPSRAGRLIPLRLRQSAAALARWIADPANPLPARVMVNRIWHYHFGRGIVATPSDFGFNGAAPSHPELLDWLASAYIAGGWRLKPIHRLIVTSAAYRQSSRLDPKAQAIDRDNRLFWRMTPRRLEAESLRDAILATSGRLDTRMGGPGYNIWEPNTNYVAVYKPRRELGPDAFRRMVYQFKPRSQPDPTFSAFDCPDAALVAPRRNVSTTASRP